MKIASFRLRLALLSALLSGIALAGFAAAVWWQVRNGKIAALDREIRAHAEREIARPRPEEHWAGYENALGRIFGAGSGEAVRVLLLVQEDGGLAFRSTAWPSGLDGQALPWPEAAEPDGFIPPPPAYAAATIAGGDARWRFGLAAIPYVRLGIGVDLAIIDAEMAAIRNAFLLAVPPALLLVGLGAGLVSGRALAPVRQLAAAMQNVTAKGLDQRLAIGREDREFRQLILVFNGMLERLERSFLQASRFSADAAHELKTPLAILQGQIEQAMAQAETGSPMQARLTGILDEVQRLGTISRKLLLLSLADAGRLRLLRVGFDLSRALEELLEDAQMLAPHLEVQGCIAAGLVLQADAELLRLVLHNLLGNAIKYNLAGGWIRISAGRRDGGIEVGIANASPGIPPAARERIFERFYRADPAHNRRVEGVGLGLSLAREIARAHGGDLLLADSGEAETRFVLVLAVQSEPRR